MLILRFFFNNLEISIGTDITYLEISFWLSKRIFLEPLSKEDLYTSHICISMEVDNEDSVVTFYEGIVIMVEGFFSLVFIPSISSVSCYDRPLLSGYLLMGSNTEKYMF